jgi:hypothetical protein
LLNVNLATQERSLLKGATKGTTERILAIIIRPAAENDDDPKERYPWQY